MDNDFTSVPEPSAVGPAVGSDAKSEIEALSTSNTKAVGSDAESETEALSTSNTKAVGADAESETEAPSTSNTKLATNDHSGAFGARKCPVQHAVRYFTHGIISYT